MVEKSDLVMLYRRKKPGMGVVIKHYPNVLGLLEHSDAFQIFIEMYSAAHDWHRRKAACDLLVRESNLARDFVDAFLRYNAFFGANGRIDTSKMKTDFVLVQWIKRPSDYESDTIYGNQSWLPTDWFKKVG